MSSLKDNPATRLFNLLEAGKAISNGVNCREAWQTILKIDKDEALLMSRLSQVMALAPQAREAMMTNFPEQTASWSHWFSQVSTAFNSQQLSGQWATFIDRIDGHAINYLKLNAQMLGYTSSANFITADKISDLRTTLAQFKDELLASDLDDHAKLTILRHVDRLSSAIDEYVITGAVSILDAVDSAIGHVMRDPAYGAALKSAGVGEKFVTILSTVANVVTVAQGLPMIDGVYSVARHLLS